jgi:ATP-dependent protease HslVU (ClpYQ) ATPase subunit
VLFELPDRGRDEVVVDAALVRERLREALDDEDLRKYIL